MSAEELVRLVAAKHARVAEEFFSMGRLLQELSRPERYKVELGYATFEEMVEARHVTNRMTASKLIAVVSTFPQRIATSLGMEKSYALMRYAAVTGAARGAVELAASNALIAGQRVSDISVHGINDARRELREKLHPPAPNEGQAAAKAAARRLQAALRQAGARDARARAHREGGVWRVRVVLSAEGATKAADVLKGE